MPIDRNHLLRVLSIATLGLALTMLTGCPGTPQTTEPANEQPSGQTVPGSGGVEALDVEGAGDGGTVSQTILGRFITLTAAPAEGYLFGGWDNLPGNDNPITIDGSGLTTVRVLFLADTDRDGVADVNDECAETSSGASVGPDGCSRVQHDQDGDFVTDALDQCPDTASGEEVDVNGCAANQRDGDLDGVTDDVDLCPTTSADDVGFVDAAGCAAGELDADEDGVANDLDECANTPRLEAADAGGCGPSQRDEDGDGVSDQADQCPGTPVDGGTVNDRGCAPAERDTDFDGVTDDADQCPDTRSGVAIDELGCELVFVDFGNDSCANRAAVSDGVVLFTTRTATTSFPLVEGACESLSADVWFSYQATCDGLVTVSLCGSTYDTMLAVYPDGSCPPTGAPMACDDDACRGSGGSQVFFGAFENDSFLLRVGGWNDSLGDGKLTVTCGGGEESGGCGPDTGDCFSGNGTPGCSDDNCCELICDLIPFCCDNNWDESCAVIANDFCTGGDPAVCGNGVVDLGEDCDPPNGVDCDDECNRLAVCGDSIIEYPEDCDPPDGTTCDTDCTFIPVCGNNRIERGEQCDPPNGTTCDDNCLLIGGGGPSTWQADNDPFFQPMFDGFLVDLTPVTYSLLTSGTLDTAEITIDANRLGVDPGDLTVFSSTIRLGARTRLFRVETIDPIFGRVTLEFFGQIADFEVDLLSGNPVPWSFDITLSLEGTIQGEGFTLSERYDGSQSGTIESNRQAISWESITGTFTQFDSNGGQFSFPLEERVPPSRLGTWDNQTP